MYTWADIVPDVRCHSESRKKGKGWERKGRRLIVKLPGSPAGLKLLAILLPQPSAAGLGPFSLPTSLFGGLLSMEQCWRLRCDPFRIRLTCCFWKLQSEPQVSICITSGGPFLFFYLSRKCALVSCRAQLAF